MKPDEVKRLLPVLTAYSNGKILQIRAVGSWKDWEDYRPDGKGLDASFENPHIEWRVKPEPRDFWINVYECYSIAFRHECNARDCADPDRIECVHVREVI